MSCRALDCCPTDPFVYRASGATTAGGSVEDNATIVDGDHETDFFIIDGGDADGVI